MAEPRSPSFLASQASDGAREADEAAQQSYFSTLLSYSLERLSKEPELLRADQEHLRRQLEDTTVERYRAFLSTAQCLGDLRAELQSATASLDALGKDLPKLAAASDAFRRDAAAANARRSDNRQLYSECLCLAVGRRLEGRGESVRAPGASLPQVSSHLPLTVPSCLLTTCHADTHSTLLELLEVPQLMDTCIRNGNYDEALDLRVRRRRGAWGLRGWEQVS